MMFTVPRTVAFLPLLTAVTVLSSFHCPCQAIDTVSSVEEKAPSGSSWPILQVPTRVACAVSYQLLDFSILSYDLYPTYFRDDSVMDLAETGEYVGLDAIEEYVRFTAPNSAYLLDSFILEQETQTLDYDRETGLCAFNLALRRRFVPRPETTNPDIQPFDAFSGAKLFYNLQENYIQRINLWFPKGVFKTIFDDVLHHPNTWQYTCNQLETTCASYITGHDPSTCVSDLSALGGVEGSWTEGYYVDGNTAGCRSLHASFVTINPSEHCTHVSIDPTDADPNGEVKCSVSERKVPEELFDEEDLDFFGTFVRTSGNIEPDNGVILNQTSQLEEPAWYQGVLDFCAQLGDVLFGGF